LDVEGEAGGTSRTAVLEKDPRTHVVEGTLEMFQFHGLSFGGFI
jgi:hypothetical protein